jgi:dipeptidyl aminopeptidase/acylaminoacyl peptidase
MLIDQQLRLEKTESGVPPGLIGSLAFDASSRRLAFTLQSPRAPADVYVLDAVAGQLTRWTESEVGVLDPASFVLPEQLQFPTWDRVAGQARQLSLAAYAADAGASSGSRPVVIWLCSGGDSLCRPRFAPFVQYLVTQLGCVVLAPEVRGSAGMGASLEQAGEGALTDDAVRDVGSLLVWIGLQPGLDHRRVAVLGEGYGSYLALQSLIRYPDRLLGAVAAFPPPLAGLSNALAIRRPLLLVQPLDNPAVPPYQAAQLREGLRAQGVLVHYVAVSGESGPFRHASVRATYQLAAASFLARLLRG